MLLRYNDTCVSYHEVSTTTGPKFLSVSVTYIVLLASRESVRAVIVRVSIDRPRFLLEDVNVVDCVTIWFFILRR